MGQSRFTKQEAEETVKAVEEMFNAIPKSRRMEYLGHYNDILLFIEAAKQAAPEPELSESISDSKSDL